MRPTRRTVVASLAAMALLPLLGCARRAPGPDLRGVPDALQKRLLTFANLVAGHRWQEALTYFDAEHLSFQRKLFFDPEYNEHAADPNDPAEVARFEEWYLRETLGLSYVDNNVDSLHQVRSISYTGVERPFGDDGPLKMLLHVETELGPRTGWFFVDPDSYTIFGASG